MKHLFILLFFILHVTVCYSQIKFSSVTHDLGTFSEDTVHLPAFHFEYVNEGKQPVHISHIKTSCGCIQASTDSQPVKPGKKGIIRVTYNPDGHPGAFNRSITVYFSNIKKPYILYIKGYVRPKEKRMFLNTSF